MYKPMQELLIDTQSPLLKNNFTFGVATSAYQIEGSTTVEGKVDSIWDVFCRQEGAIANSDSGEIACDHFNRWKEDIALMKSLNIEAYRLSISWPRVISSIDREINQQGLNFYQQIIDCLIEQGIKPYITLYHWDLPQYLQDIGGWQNRKTAEEFAFYADIVSQFFGDKIVAYATFNEPWVTSFLGHLHGIHAPGLQCRKATYHSVHHQLLAHGLALPLLRKNAPNSQHGIVLNGGPSQAATDSFNDKYAANIAYQEQWDLFLSPLMSGCYPDTLLELYQNYLPKNYQEDLLIIKQTVDYIGVNYYTRNVVQSATPVMSNQYTCYENAEATEFEKTAMGWDVYPQGLKMTIDKICQDYQLPAIMIMENGAAFDDKVTPQGVDDPRRVQYFKAHLAVVSQLVISGINISAYFAWSFLDNFEWAEGYNKRFGLVHVDFESQQRTIKRSGIAYGDMLAFKHQLRGDK
ncbi:GH1 family beta-glucosidase [Thalassotalea sp. PLHSN55]|uniref:GH1 family beta-glucosidase n=1 Tax=Thalassotalea sp. PLHSN55 TaxID=3435888 RepID=UPI003F855280